MSKTVTIPSDVSRMEIHINNDTYVYAGGSTVTVPDEVAQLLANNEANKPKGTRPVYAPLEAGLGEGTDVIEVFTDGNGVLRIMKKDIQDMMPEPELPDFPTTDGTYTLQAVVDEGEVTLSWEAVEEDTAPDTEET